MKSQGDASFVQEITARFGMMPNFFCSTPATAGLIQELWAFAKSAYLDNPLGSLFKERLFVYLSRFCPVRYCIVRHVGFLIGRGNPAGDSGATPETVAQVVALLRRPLPDAAGLDAALSRLESYPEPRAIPAPATPAEGDLYDALAVMFVEPRRSERARHAVRKSVGEAGFERLTAFLAFVRTAHYWTETHPELAYEPDMVSVMAGHEELAQLLLDPSEAERVQAGEALRRALVSLREMQGALDNQEARLQGVLAATRMATWHEDAETGAVVTSGTMAELFGLLPGNHLKSHSQVSQLIHPEDVERRGAAVRSGNNWRVEFRVIRPRDGRTVWLEERGKVVRDPATGKVALEGLTWDVTERKQAEEALRESEERFRAVANLVPDLLWSSEPSGYTGWYNQRWMQYTGQSFGQATGWGWTDAIHPEDREVSARRYRAAIETGTPLQQEHRIRRHDGQYRWFLVRAEPVRDAAGQVLRWLGSATDVHDFRCAAEALRASETRWRLIVESARDFAIFSLDSRGMVTSWNAGAQAILGYPESEMIGRSGEVIFTPEDRARGESQREIEGARRDGRAEDERWHLRKDGRRFWASGVLTSMRGPDGQVVGFLKILRDLTTVRQAQEAHRQAEERFRLFVGSLQDYAVFLLDPQGRVTSWNPGAQRITGYAEAEVLGRPVSMFYPPEALAEGLPEREIGTALAQGRAESEGWRVRKRGERFWVNEIMVRLPRPHEGPATGLAKICRDLTERKAAEDERARLLAEAEAANRAKDRFLAALSHELRTPLTPVRMAMFGLQRERGLSAAGREALAMMDRNLERERQLIDDLLDVSRIAHGKLDVRRAPVDLHVCVRAALEVCRDEAAAKRLQLTIELAAASPMVLGDEPRLQQVFWNLVQNATKFTPEGGAVTVRSRDLAEGGVAVDVTDTGVGIAPEFLPKLFDPFEQGSAEVGRRHGGLGLGLAISQAIVQAHDGRLTAASAGLGQGATFTVELPARAATNGGGAAPPKHA